MKEYMEKRVLDEAQIIIDEKLTVRATAKIFLVSKSTVFKDVTERLNQINPELASKVKEVLEINKEERHMRGGYATRNKYLAIKNSK